MPWDFIPVIKSHLTWGICNILWGNAGFVLLKEILEELGMVRNSCAFSLSSWSLLFILSPNRFHAPSLLFFCWASKYFPVAEFLPEGRGSAALSLLTRDLWKEQTGGTGEYWGTGNTGNVGRVCSGCWISWEWNIPKGGWNNRGINLLDVLELSSFTTSVFFCGSCKVIMELGIICVLGMRIPQFSPWACPSISI